MSGNVFYLCMVSSATASIGSQKVKSLNGQGKQYTEKQYMQLLFVYDSYSDLPDILNIH